MQELIQAIEHMPSVDKDKYLFKKRNVKVDPFVEEIYEKLHRAFTGRFIEEMKKNAEYQVSDERVQTTFSSEILEEINKMLVEGFKLYGNAYYNFEDSRVKEKAGEFVRDNVVISGGSVFTPIYNDIHNENETAEDVDVFISDTLWNQMSFEPFSSEGSGNFQIFIENILEEATDFDDFRDLIGRNYGTDVLKFVQKFSYKGKSIDIVVNFENNNLDWFATKNEVLLTTDFDMYCKTSYYNGEVYALDKAIEDIREKKASILSNGTPFSTLVRCLRMEERYGFQLSELDKDILLHTGWALLPEITMKSDGTYTDIFGELILEGKTQKERVIELYLSALQKVKKWDKSFRKCFVDMIGQFYESKKNENPKDSLRTYMISNITDVQKHNASIYYDRLVWFFENQVFQYIQEPLSIESFPFDKKDYFKPNKFFVSDDENNYEKLFYNKSMQEKYRIKTMENYFDNGDHQTYEDIQSELEEARKIEKILGESKSDGATARVIVMLDDFFGQAKKRDLRFNRGLFANHLKLYLDPLSLIFSEDVYTFELYYQFETIPEREQMVWAEKNNFISNNKNKKRFKTQFDSDGRISLQKNKESFTFQKIVEFEFLYLNGNRFEQLTDALEDLLQKEIITEEKEKEVSY